MPPLFPPRPPKAGGDEVMLWAHPSPMAAPCSAWESPVHLPPGAEELIQHGGKEVKVKSSNQKRICREVTSLALRFIERGWDVRAAPTAALRPTLPPGGWKGAAPPALGAHLGVGRRCFELPCAVGGRALSALWTASPALA